MVLAELGSQITEALRRLQSASVIDEETLDECLKDICRALLLADVRVNFVNRLKINVKQSVKASMPEGATAVAKRKFIQKAVIEELVKMLTAERAPYVPKRGRPNIILFVGLQGSGKTTTCTKYAHYYQRKGWRTALVCADTFRAGAFDQLKQNATKAKIPFFGSYTEADPVRIAMEGVEQFKAERYEIIVVDTSGRHKQEAALFDEMKQVAEAVSPDDVVFVMDSHIGQACYDQAVAFRSTVEVGSVIVTKLDGHAKGGGALSAVAATQSPIVFIGTGEHFDEFEAFEPKSFLSRLLGMGDISGLFTTITEAFPLEGQQEIIQKLAKGQISLRNMYDQYQNMMKIGPLGKVMSMIPGLGQNPLGKDQEQESIRRMRRMIHIMDSMTAQELDLEKTFNDSRILRVARGSGAHPEEVKMLLEQHKTFSKMFSRMGKMGLNKDATMQNMMRNPQQMMQRMHTAMDPRMLKQLGGAGNMMNLVQQFSNLESSGGMEGMEGLQDMMRQMQGGRGGPAGRGRRR
eukprot:GHVT01022824.1.p1 GENE.GHVT01022824.1~~GHVT01022824.1.p1  ORF type:complete len:519 (+),score=104.24 GHVT01022824.1:143-1699(+)